MPDPGVQRRIVRFVQASPDQLVHPHQDLVRPATVFRRFRRQSEELESYAYDFFGVAPERAFWDDDDYERHNMWEFGQFVFDRSAGGRFVTVLPPDPAHLERGERLLVRNGGYTRECSRATFVALKLVLVKLRYCPSMEIDDDYYVARTVESDLATWMLGDALRRETLDLDECWDRYLAAARVHAPDRFRDEDD